MPSDTPRTDSVERGLEGAASPMTPENWKAAFEWMCGHARHLERDYNACHNELLAIHEVIMNPMDVVISGSDTFTVAHVKAFILRLRETEEDLRLAQIAADEAHGGIDLEPEAKDYQRAKAEEGNDETT